jgi:hypothetical protein
LDLNLNSGHFSSPPDITNSTLAIFSSPPEVLTFLLNHGLKSHLLAPIPAIFHPPDLKISIFSYFYFYFYFFEKKKKKKKKKSQRKKILIQNLNSDFSALLTQIQISSLGGSSLPFFIHLI